MLTCSVSPSTPGWEYSWYSDTTTQPLTAGDVVFHSNDRISVSQDGLYWCAGERGTPRYYTVHSDIFVAITPVVKLNHNWPEVFYGEKTRLTCEMKGGENIAWEYEWMKQQVVLPENKKEHVVVHATTSDYMCRAGSTYGQTWWSKAFTLTVIDSPNLSVSSLWPNPGASVNLNCAAKHPSAGWRFYWYKLIPDIAREYLYDYELLPGSTNGTTQDSYVVYNHTNTAGYACRAGRGDPVHYTSYSHKFVWSREFQSPPSLRVSPDKVQHFWSDSVSLTCEGNSSTQWTVVKFGQDGFTSQRCSGFGTLTGSTCTTQLNEQHAVYWCESKSGQFSSAINISVSFKDILLDSPTHPVAEGAAVTLRCKLKTGNFVANVVFYKNDKVVQNDMRWTLTIPAVSESHEGFYRCERKYSQRTLTSPQSWISVKSLSKPESSPGHLPLIVGLVCGVLVIIPLLLFFCYGTSKDSNGNSQTFATDQTVNQGENQQQVYSTLLHGDVCIYETVGGAGNIGTGHQHAEVEELNYNYENVDSGACRTITMDRQISN
uniref:sialoadhesin-like isoform X4 n=1 Tax=Solea senegalensis TaxID=28829 RepID=UPI001CD81E03|nr:sialoadhesin-like isoform X4 [Solea senegalensis]